MEKKMINGVYTILGVDSTSQVREFYAEVVEKNIEKYVAITTQNIKFRFNAAGDCAEILPATKEYAINPMYRKIDVPKIDDLVPETAQEPTDEKEPEEKVVEEVQVENKDEFVPEHIEEPKAIDVDCAEQEEVKEVTKSESATEEFVKPEKVQEEDIEYDENYEKVHDEEDEITKTIEEKPIDETKPNAADEIAQLDALANENYNKAKLEKERADNAEKELAFVKAHCKDLENEIEDKKIAIENLAEINENLKKTNQEIADKLTEIEERENQIEVNAYSVEDIFDIAEKLGYEVWIKKIK